MALGRYDRNDNKTQSRQKPNPAKALLRHRPLVFGQDEGPAAKAAATAARGRTDRTGPPPRLAKSRTAPPGGSSNRISGISRAVEPKGKHH